MVKAKKTRGSKKREGLLVKVSTFFIKRWKAGVAIWLALLVGGAVIYTGVIGREGFPPISFPLSIVTGSYAVNDVEKVDSDVAKPISESLSAIEQITSVESSAGDNFFTVAVGFDETLTSETGTQLVRDTIETQVELPQEAALQYSAIDPGSFLFEYDMLVYVYATQEMTAAEIDAAAERAAEQLVSLDVVDRADAKNTVVAAQDPRTGEVSELQRNFSRIGVSEGDEIGFFPATVIGVDRVADTDIIDLSDEVNTLLDNLTSDELGEGVSTLVGADFAADIDGQINFLESNMLTGLIAVSLISLLLITWRASLITALFMLTVMVSTIVVLYVIGYTLNTITLFALILSLGLFVDDATIVVESIDVSKRKKKASQRAIVAEAVQKVGAASFAGTLTTVLVFAILATPTGILGEFIRLIPITVIIALLLSFILSITLIPLLSKFIMLQGHEPDWFTRNNPIIKLEEWLGKLMQSNIESVRTGPGKVKAFLAIGLSIVMINVGGYYFGNKVDQNIFPPAKDSDQIAVEINYAPNTTIEQAQTISADVEKIVANVVGDEFVQAVYGLEQQSTASTSVMTVDLTSFTDREIKSPQIVANLDEEFANSDIPVATIRAAQVDNGPPASQFPFGIRIKSDDTDMIREFTNVLAEDLVGQELTAMNGDKINITNSRISGVDGQILRDEGERYGITRFAYDNNNATLVTLLTEERFEELFDDARLESFGITADDVAFDAGQEGDFQDSFGTLVIAVPVALVLMFVLLAVQFRSVLQPLLILLAIPFTIFGVGVGLYATNNAASFFALTGFIGLIGIAVNNTIMMTDYANQERRAGNGAITAIANAANKRLRPLIATSVTTVAALLPLALSDPFWEALAFTIIFGLISSTFLVLVAFPYYYLALEWVKRLVRRIFRRKQRA